MNKKKNFPLLEEIPIESIAAEGKAIARHENKVIFVKQVAPGDIADIQIVKIRKNYLEGIPVKIREYSSLREKPVCDHFGTCGGCKWQHIKYEEQLKFKQNQVVDQFKRIGDLEFPEPLKIKPSPAIYFYRNKIEFTFSDMRWLTKEEMAEDKKDLNGLGFHISGRYDKVLDIQFCHLQNTVSNEIRNSLRQFTLKNGMKFYNLRYNTGFLRNLVIRTTMNSEVMLIVVFAEKRKKEIEQVMNYLKSSFPQITSLNYVINTKLNDSIHDLDIVNHSGKDHLIEQFENLKFKIGTKSFFQTNSRQALELYRTVREFAALKGENTVYDLYTGTGTIANFIARDCKRVIGIEIINEAIEDARMNAVLNNTRNTRFFAGDLVDVINEEFINGNGLPDTIILDPPRAGIHKKILNLLLQILPSRIVYVSCNPATQARDLSLLKNHYQIEKMQPFDMFPHTHHVENIAALGKK
ncbi:23S rRNA (uracil(1939)-C(5))-methyltransferase RlmD [Bacteroidota bacterium]